MISVTKKERRHPFDPQSIDEQRKRDNDMRSKQRNTETATGTKDIRMEVKLTSSINEKLEFCSETLGFSKSEIIRMAIEEKHTQVVKQKEISDALKEGESMEDIISAAQEERATMVYEDAYKEAFNEAYTKEYAELIVDPDVEPDEADERATDIAKEIADEAAKEAQKDFWNSVRNHTIRG